MNHPCQETTGMIGNEYLRCGAPAVALIQHRGRHEGPYYMCRGCADHNVHNRNADVVAWMGLWDEVPRAATMAKAIAFLSRGNDDAK